MSKGSRQRKTLIDKQLADINYDIAICRDPINKEILQKRRDEIKANIKLNQKHKSK